MDHQTQDYRLDRGAHGAVVANVLVPGCCYGFGLQKTEDTVEIEAWVSPRRALLQFGSLCQHVERLVAALGY